MGRDQIKKAGRKGRSFCKIIGEVLLLFGDPDGMNSLIVINWCQVHAFCQVVGCVKGIVVFSSFNCNIFFIYDFADHVVYEHSCVTRLSGHKAI